MASSSGTITFSDEARRRRLASRHLLERSRRAATVEEVVASLVALHSSDPATVYLTATARLAEPAIGLVDEALYERRSLVRYHAMRSTLWVFPLDTVADAHVCATAKAGAAQRRRLAKIADLSGIDDAHAWLGTSIERAERLVDEHGPITARELGRLAPELTVGLDGAPGSKWATTIKAHTRLLPVAGFEARVVRTRPTGGWTNAEYRWATPQNWFGHPLVEGRANDAEASATEAETKIASAAARMLGRWLAAFGPATETDVRWWFGWTARLARSALASVGAEEVRLDSGDIGWVLPGDTEPVGSGEPWVAVLPSLDPTSMGWKQRDWYLVPEVAAKVTDRAGNIGPTIWADGRIVGSWVQRPDASIAHVVFERLSSEHNDLLDVELERTAHTVGDTVVKPRFRAPVQTALLS